MTLYYYETDDSSGRLMYNSDNAAIEKCQARYGESLMVLYKEDESGNFVIVYERPKLGK